MTKYNPHRYVPKVTFSIEEIEIENILAWNMEKFLGLKFLQRQVKTPAGIIDMIAKDEDNDGIYYIIELKKDILDASAFCQVHRYASYLNSNCTKDGKRLFIPLLIGKNINDEILKCLHIYSKNSHNYMDIGRTFYALYDIDAINGMSFSFQRTDQKKYEDEHLSSIHGFIEKMCGWDADRDYAEYLLRELKEQLEGDITTEQKPNLTIVK